MLTILYEILDSTNSLVDDMEKAIRMLIKILEEVVLPVSESNNSTNCIHSYLYSFPQDKKINVI